MEQIVLRPRPLPGQEPDGGGGAGGGEDAGAGTDGCVGHRPHTGRLAGRRPASLLCGLFAGAVLVLSGVALGALGTSVVAMRELGELRDQVAREASQAPVAPDVEGRPGVLSAPVGSKSSGASGASIVVQGDARATLGLEVVDGGKSGARVVAVHVPGPGYTAGLVRGDVLLSFGRTRIGSATDLARAVERAGPGRRIDMTVRHKGGGKQRLSMVLGVVV
ncbi:PDZ domain-containing protein [Streptomyces sp. NPDC006172]|uniref:PDZ domain-containing protein n=1 Tax=Streptomyces sp. NPDC006172 TaxID=3154470 RepID=UPI0033E879EE